MGEFRTAGYKAGKVKKKADWSKWEKRAKRLLTGDKPHWLTPKFPRRTRFTREERAEKMVIFCADVLADMARRKYKYKDEKARWLKALRIWQAKLPNPWLT